MEKNELLFVIWCSLFIMVCRWKKKLTALNYGLQIENFKRYLTQGMEDTKANSSHAGFWHLVNDLNDDFRSKKNSTLFL